jgi:SUMO ligase MMS21 Smc5/6 complex component
VEEEEKRHRPRDSILGKRLKGTTLNETCTLCRKPIEVNTCESFTTHCNHSYHKDCLTKMLSVGFYASKSPLFCMGKDCLEEFTAEDLNKLLSREQLQR